MKIQALRSSGVHTRIHHSLGADVVCWSLHILEPLTFVYTLLTPPTTIPAPGINITHHQAMEDSWCTPELLKALIVIPSELWHKIKILPEQN